MSGEDDFEQARFVGSEMVGEASSEGSAASSNGWSAQSGVFLFDRESGKFIMREQGDC
jgi:hypothetical protein